jgi:hypothetical protein
MTMLSTRTLIPALLAVSSLLIGLVPAQLFAFDAQAPTFVQGLLGAAQYSEDDLTFTEVGSDGITTSENDLSNMPYFGLAFQQPFRGKNTQIGLDGSAFLGWRVKDRRVVAGDNQIAITVDSSLWLFDLSIGIYVKHTFKERWRVYAAAGPALIFGEYSDDTDEDDLVSNTTITTSRSESEFGSGGYARAGFDYRYADNAYLGICVRGISTNLEFSGAPEASSGLSGTQVLVSFSRHF